MDIDVWVTGEGAIVVAGLVEVAKRLLKLPMAVEDRALPLLALVLGVLWQALALSYANAPDQRWQTIAVAGLLSGLVASGVWAQATALIRGFREGAGQVAPRG